MDKLTESYVDSLAPNQNAIVNGWGLVKKNSFTKLHITADQTVIFGDCLGSGTGVYHTSVDMADPSGPICRCSCPSRQFPCKHAMGLMYAYTCGKVFTTDTLPEDIAQKREKAEKRETKKHEPSSDTPKKVNKSALQKKIKAQLEGLELLEKIIDSTVRSGLGAITPRIVKELEAQARQLGDYYLPGAQASLRAFVLLFKHSADTETDFIEASQALIRLYALCRKGREYLNSRLEKSDLGLDPTTTMDEWLGHAWQLSELKELGLTESNVNLLQLSFNSYSDEARQEFIDAGLWLNLNSGRVVETRNYRPYKAAKYIKEEDSFFSVAHLEELFIYPGDLNPRVRWETMTVRSLEPEDYARVHGWAHLRFLDILKTVKNQIKNPLAAKQPVALLKYHELGRIGDAFVIEDVEGQRLVLTEDETDSEPAGTHILKLLPETLHRNQTMLVRFIHNTRSMRLMVKPLSIISDTSVIRLIY